MINLSFVNPINLNSQLHDGYPMTELYYSYHAQSHYQGANTY